MLFFKGKIYAYSFKFKFKTSSIFSIRLSKISHYLRPSDNKSKPLPSALINALLQRQNLCLLLQIQIQNFLHFLHQIIQDLPLSTSLRQQIKTSSISSD